MINEYQDTFQRGDFLVRNVMGVDPDSGALAINDAIRVGQTVQFHVRDAQSAAKICGRFFRLPPILAIRDLAAGFFSRAMDGARGSFPRRTTMLRAVPRSSAIYL